MAYGARPVPRSVILGAGNGGQAMAAYLSLHGHEVRLYNRLDPQEEKSLLEPVRERGGVELQGATAGFGRVAMVSTDIEEVLGDGFDLLHVVVPSVAHRRFAEQCAPYLRSGQTVLLHPGRTGGALEFAHRVRECGGPKDLLIGETYSLLFACRLSGPATVGIFGVKNSVPFGVLPSVRTGEMMERIADPFPQFRPVENVLVTSLGNTALQIHVTTMVLNAGRIEDPTSEFHFIKQGVSPSVGRVMEAVDRERIAVGRALGVELPPAEATLKEAYDTSGKDLRETLHNVEAYPLNAPSTLDVRYLWEDCPMGCVPTAALGRLGGVPTPTVDGLIALASALLGRDFWAEGRTAERMGLAGMSAEDIRRYVRDGEQAI